MYMYMYLAELCVLDEPCSVVQQYTIVSKKFMTRDLFSHYISLYTVDANSTSPFSIYMLQSFNSIIAQIYSVL